MAITRDDIINKVFTRAVLGYDENEVDSFLDDIMVDVENAQQRLAEAYQENEKLKNSINRINEDAARVMASRQEINRLKDDNKRLQTEIGQLKMKLNEEASRGRNRAEVEIEAQNLILDSKTQAEEITRNAQAQARDTVKKGENEAERILREAKESANKIAQNVQERERQIMDRAQERARQILDIAQNKAASVTQRGSAPSQPPQQAAYEPAQQSYQGYEPAQQTYEPQHYDGEQRYEPETGGGANDNEWPGWLER